MLYCTVLYCSVQQEENGGTEQVTGSVSGFPPVYLQTGQLGEEVT